ncbi:hypothetical protein K402DRAFT_316402, partial [Aulographum hederae CBS 113979]
NESTICFCGGVEEGTSIGCDNSKCPIKWFHLECVDLKVLPPKDVKWFCKDC